MAVTSGIYDDASLPAKILNIDFQSPWPRQPVLADFVGESKPIMQVPVLSWAISKRENDWRTALISYLQSVYPTYTTVIQQNITNLPDNFINGILGNVFYNTNLEYEFTLLPRIENTFNTSPYAAAALWIGYHLCGLIQLDFSGLTDNESLYRIKQLTDLQLIIGYTLRTSLGYTPSFSANNTNVIVAATTSTTETITIVTDNRSLNQYLTKGGSLNKLCSQWITQKYNPTI